MLEKTIFLPKSKKKRNKQKAKPRERLSRAKRVLIDERRAGKLEELKIMLEETGI